MCLMSFETKPDQRQESGFHNVLLCPLNTMKINERLQSMRIQKRNLMERLKEKIYLKKSMHALLKFVTRTTKEILFFVMIPPPTLF